MGIAAVSRMECSLTTACSGRARDKFAPAERRRSRAGMAAVGGRRAAALRGLWVPPRLGSAPWSRRYWSVGRSCTAWLFGVSVCRWIYRVEDNGLRYYVR